MANIPSELERLGKLLRDGRVAEAEHGARRLLARAPQDVNAVSMMGFVLLRAGKAAEAEYFVRRTVAALPEKPRTHVNLAKTVWMQGKHDEAATILTEAHTRWPTDPEVGETLGELLLTRQRPAAALTLADRCLAVHRSHAGLLGVRAKSLQRLGSVEEAIPVLARAAELRADRADLLESLAFMEQYNPAVTPASLCAAHRRWGEAVCAAVRPLPERDLPSPGAPLRVGLVSPDFRRHAVACFTASFVRHAPPEIDLTCYSVALHEDEVSAEFKRQRVQWRSVPHLDNPALAALIARDRIDVLIDVAGHTNNDRLRLFAMRPAPVLITYVGYAGTTGLDRFDARLIDETTDPPGAEAAAAEPLIRIGTPHHCYHPFEPPPEVAPAPCVSNGLVTFGSFGGVIKMNRPLLSLWARVLEAVPSARFLLKHGSSIEPEAIDALGNRCAEAGIPTNRLTILGAAPTHADHLRAYAQMDIALDTQPFSGATTTCEALLMGVPVLTLPGRTHASRMTASMLKGANHPEWIAADEDAFVALAARMAADTPAITARRRSLRAEMLASALCDGPGHAARFTRGLQEAVALVRQRRYRKPA